MSAYGDFDATINNIWGDIINRHWSYLDSEESLKKLEERKKLEELLKVYISIVPHERKFFLNATSIVLRRSVCEMEGFSAYKASIAFDAICQYANNLYTKPWRKEFRIIKMYSGYYTHEIKANLADAVILFEAMGYKRISDEVLVMVGPICPDQVANVSREAMIAYMECQAMKEIYMGLVSMSLNCDWKDVFKYRQEHVGNPEKAVKGLAYAIMRMQKKQQRSDDSYASIPRQKQVGNSTFFSYQRAQPTSNAQMQQSLCPIHAAEASGKMIASYPAGYQQQSQQQQQMTHSRSLEHYNQPPATLAPQRHSFDHQPYAAHHSVPPRQHYMLPATDMLPYESQHSNVYDCIDGDESVDGNSSVSYSAVATAHSKYNPAYAHPYNVSSNRNPLPYNVSAQLQSSHYDVPPNGSSNSAGYATVQKPYKHKAHYYHQNEQEAPLPPTRYSSVPAAHQSHLPSEHLIVFDDRAPLTSNDFHAQLAQKNNGMFYERGGGAEAQQQDMSHNKSQAKHFAALNATYAEPKDLISHTTTATSSNAQSSDELLYVDDHLYAHAQASRAAVKEKKGILTAQSKMTDKHLRNSQQAQGWNDNNMKLKAELKERKYGTGIKVYTVPTLEQDDTSDYSDLKCDEFVNVKRANAYQQQQQQPRSPTQEMKNQDGVGTFDSWHMVYMKSNNAMESNDINTKMDALSLSNNGLEKCSKPTTTASESAKQTNGEKLRTLEKTATIKNNKTEITKGKLPFENNVPNKKLMEKNSQNFKAVAQLSSTGAIPKQKSNLKSAALSDKANGNLNGNRMDYERKSALQLLPDNAPGPNQWSCVFCTYHNPNTKRICEMCSKTKDFQMDAGITQKRTCA